MEKTSSICIVLFSFLITSSAFASNRIQSIELDISGAVFIAHCFADDQLIVDNGETIRLLLKLPDPDDEKIQLINRVVGQARATGVTSGYEYIGSVMIEYLDLPLTPDPHSDTVNIVNGRGAGTFLLNVEWVAPSYPEVGVSMVKSLIAVVFQGGGVADFEFIQQSLKVECKGLALN